MEYGASPVAAKRQSLCYCGLRNGASRRLAIAALLPLFALIATPLSGQSGGLTLSATSLNFAPQPVGTTSPVALPVVLKNTGTAIVNFSAITASSNFTEADDCGKGLAGGYSCTVNVSFAPAATGAAGGTLTIADDASGGLQTVKLAGTGVPSPTLTGLTILHAFAGGTTDGSAPQGPPLAQDAAGNFYGVSPTGGANSHGAVFELVKSATAYSEHLLYSFTDTNGDGAVPNGGLLIDSSGNLYGTTRTGGASASCTGGCGIVFELVNASGSYALKVLHTFDGKPDGAEPDSGLVLDSQGNLYGATFIGGAYNLGTVYAISRTPLLATPWTVNVLRSFGPESNQNSQNPSGNLVVDNSGNVYGTATLAYSGYSCTLENASCGVLFELVNSAGSYAERDLQPFSAQNDWLSLDSSGNIYFTETGGYGNGGSVYEIKNGNVTQLHGFGGTGDGAYPEGPVVTDSNGDVYGTTSAGGSLGDGAIFELVNSSGSYSEKVLYNFTGKTDGSAPENGLVIDTAGTLWGAASGGANGDGTIFEFGSVFAISPLSVDAPPAINYGDVVTGVASTTSLTLTNVGDTNLTFGSLAISGTNAADFAISGDDCSGQTMAPGADCAVDLSFTPIAISAASAQLSFPADSSFIQQQVNLTGAGVSAAVVSFSPPALNFPDTTVGSSAALPVTLSNTGTAPLVISGIVSAAGDFTETNNCPATLVAGSSCTISVVYTPSFAGPEMGSITVTDDAAGSPQSVTLSGAGTVNLAADQLTVLHSFTNVTPDGLMPAAGMLRDAAGNLYGISTGALGTVFELQYNGGTYTEVILHAFSGPAAGGSNADGAVPQGNLIMDSAGNIYGTTSQGGSNGDGAVFELVSASGKYTYKQLYSFHGPLGDGATPNSAIVLDASGDIFGTTAAGGSGNVPGICASGCGTVFELVNANGSYSEKVLHSFQDGGSDGYTPQGLVIDDAGDLFGTTAAGGTCAVGGRIGCGTVFELVNSAGNYTEKVLYDFTGSGGDGASPIGSLIMDAGGNIYGVTQSGGTSAVGGTVYEMVYSSGSYTNKILYTFETSSSDGFDPSGGLLIDSSGSLYGVTSEGGANGTGAIYALADSSGAYTESVLYSFAQSSRTGNHPAVPVGSLVADPVGNLYGVTQSGGLSGFGTAYEFTLHAAVPLVSLSSPGLAFGSVPVGTVAAPQSVKVTNSGNAPLDFTSITVNGDFSVFNAGTTCSTSAPLAAEASCSIEIEFTPTKVGSRIGALTLSDNATGSPQSLNLSGAGTPPPLAIATASLPAGAVGASYSQTFAATGGVSPYTWSIASGSLPTGLTLNTSTGAITGTPTIQGTSAFVVKVTDAESTPQTATADLSILITIAAAPALTISPTSLTFSAQNTGSTSAAQTLKLTNSGSAPLNVTSIAASGDFAQTNNCGASVAASGNCTVSVTFTPTAGGTRTGTLTITDNASGSPQTVSMTGTGSTVNVTSSSTSLSISSTGGSATAAIQLSPAGGFSGTVNLACTVTYQGTGTATDAPACSLNPTQQQVSGTGSVSTTLTVNTTAASSAQLDNRSFVPFGGGAVAALLLFVGVPRRRWRGWCMLAVLCILIAGTCLGCGSGSSPGNTPTDPGTTTGSYNVTVTATSGTVTTSMTLPLTVQ